MKKETEDFLKSIGQSTSGYEYLGTMPKFITEKGTDSVTINGKKVPLNKRLLNYKNFEYFLLGDGDNGLSACIGDLTRNTGKYNTMVSIMSGYFGDILKLAEQEIPEKTDLIQALIVRANNEVADKSADLFRKYDRDLREIEMNTQARLSDRQAQTLYEAQNDKIVCATIYPSRTIFGDPSGIISISSQSRHNVAAELAGVRAAAFDMKEIEEKSAKSSLDEKLVELVSDELTTFALNFEDIYVLEKKEFFDHIDYRSADISNCPYKYYSYIKEEKFKKEDFENVKKVMNYYDILDDFLYDLEVDVSEKVGDIVYEDQELYKGKNLDLYLFLTGKKDIHESEKIKKNLYEDFKDELGYLNIDEYGISEDDVKKAKEILSRIKKNKDLFTEEQYSKLENKVNSILSKRKKFEKDIKKDDPERKKKIRKLIIIGVVILFWVVIYPFFKDPEEYGQYLGIFIGILIAVKIQIAIIKFIKKILGL